MAAVEEVAGSGEQRGSLVGGRGAAVAAVAAVGEVVVVVVVSSRLAGGLWLVLTPACTQKEEQRGRQ